MKKLILILLGMILSVPMFGQVYKNFVIEKPAPTIFLKGSGGVINFNTGDITLSQSSNLLTLAGGNFSLGANSILSTGSFGSTGGRILKGWFTNLEITNPPTINGAAMSTLFVPVNNSTLIGLTTIASLRLGSTTLTVTGSEINGLSGIGGNVKTLIDAKAPTSNPVFLNTVTLPSDFRVQALPENTSPDTILVWHNGKIYYSTSGNLSDYIYPVEPPATPSSTARYVATSGNNGNDGSYEHPWLTWQWAFNQLDDDDTLYIRGGNYTDMYGLYSSNYYGVRVNSAVAGSSGHPIVVMNYPGETPVLDCTNLTSTTGEHYGIILDGTSYWVFQGITVANVAENTNHSAPSKGWEIIDADHITLIQCVTHHCGNGFTNGGDYIYYTNCDSYEHHDYYDQGGLSNGFNCNIQSGYHVYYYGCRSWGNSDDGFDYYGAAADSYISTLNCWVFENGPWSEADIHANGDGIKTGSATEGTVGAGVYRTITNCLVWSNHGAGLQESVDGNIKTTHHVYNNTLWDNSYDFNYWESGATDIIRNNISFGYRIARGDTGEGTVNTVDHNSWQNSLNCTSADFVSIDPTGTKGARQSDGSLPVLNFLKLVTGSDMINAGVNVGISYSGAAPDLGAYEKE